jgi:hypothetical protein
MMKQTMTTNALKPRKNPVGRPHVVTDEAVAQLVIAFSIDATVVEACALADISRDAFYDYLKLNPDFSDRIARLREKPVLKARQTVVNNLTDPEIAFKYLERKRKSEFAARTELTGASGEALTLSWQQSKSHTRPDTGQTSFMTLPDDG